jgi:hypothetical protein
LERLAVIVDGYITEIHLTGEFAQAIQWQQFAVNKLRDILRAKRLVQGVMNLGDVQMRYFINHSSKLAKVWVEASAVYLDSGRTHITESFPDIKDEERPWLKYLYKRDDIAGETTLAGPDTEKGETAETIYGKISGKNISGWPTDITKTFFMRQPTRYSGLMREVVQLLVGMGKPVEFGYSFTDTHGVVQTSNGKFWVVNISAASGVRAKPLQLGQKLTNANTTILGEYAANSILTKLPKSGSSDMFTNSSVELLAATGMSDFYAKSPYFEECGWAFSYDSLEARNTCCTGDGSSSFVEGFHYALTFSEDSEGNLDSASLSLIESGHIVGSIAQSFKVPEGTTFASFDWSPPGSMGYDTYPSEDVAFYVFYTRDNGLVECRHRNQSAISTTDVNTIPTSTPLGGEFGPNNRELHLYTGSYTRYTEQSWAEEASYISSYNGLALGATHRVASSVQNIEVGVGDGLGPVVRSASGLYYAHAESSRLSYSSTNDGGRVIGATSCVSATYGDRESAYLYSAAYSSETTWGEGATTYGYYYTLEPYMTMVPNSSPGPSPNDWVYEVVSGPHSSGLDLMIAIGLFDKYGVGYSATVGTRFYTRGNDVPVPTTTAHIQAGEQTISVTQDLALVHSGGVETITPPTITQDDLFSSKFIRILTEGETWGLYGSRDAFTNRGYASTDPQGAMDDSTLDLNKAPYTGTWNARDAYVGIPYNIGPMA